MDWVTLNEQTSSQLPALKMLQNLGYSYLTPDEARRLRGGRLQNILLEDILLEWLRRNNRIVYKGREFPFSEGNLISAVEGLKIALSDGLVRSNEKIYDILTLGKSFQQSIHSDLRSFSLRYIDWSHPENNSYHVTEEFTVEREGSERTRRPDMVLFVNGIPFVVMECKSNDIKDAVDVAISQMIRNQKPGEIPHLFHYAQLLLAVCGQEAKYATVGTGKKHWSVWREKENQAAFEQDVLEIVNRNLSIEQIQLLSEASRQLEMGWRVEHIKSLNSERLVAEQDRALFALCRPERLLALTYRYMLFDGPNKKIARYQQYFAVEKIMDRIQNVEGGRRTGGVVWHTQGSGKSLTMVMLAKAIALCADISNHKIVLVTDRIDLDEQIKANFQQTGFEVNQATTGKELAGLLASPKPRIISTVINKFEAAVSQAKNKNTDPNIFVLVDEGHRTQYGSFHARMRQSLPNACYIGFTGTPVLKKDRDTVHQFGGMIDTYTITQAVKDCSVVELLYEGRHVHQIVDKSQMDKWFERETHAISEQQAQYLKMRFAATDPLNKAAQKVREIAFDISHHFKNNFQGTPFKGQLVAQDKEHALLFRDFLNDIDMVTAEVLISGPDEREGETDVHSENKLAVQRFWNEMMSRYGNEKEYNKQLINAFKYGDDLEIIIVVDKLLTGFDAPRNTVLYLTRPLKDHALLQAIARVNRVYEEKDYGYIIDYAGVLANLDDALELYGKLDGFNPDDLKGILKDVTFEIRKLKERHTILWDTFKQISNKQDIEAYEQMLADQETRDRFYDRLTAYSKSLSVAMSTVKFFNDTDEKDIQRYTNDLKFFTKLRVSVKRRYAEILDFSQYEPKIKKLLDMYVGTESTEQITPMVEIFDKEAFKAEVDNLVSTGAKADTIAYRTRRTISERMNEDPVFYQRFSEMLQRVIDDYRRRRISENDYLARVTEVMESVANRTGDEIPETLDKNEVAKAYFGITKKYLWEYFTSNEFNEDEIAEIALAICDIINRNRIVHWVENEDVKNRMRLEIEDWMFDFAKNKNIDLNFDMLDKILDDCIDVAKIRMAEMN